MEKIENKMKRKEMKVQLENGKKVSLSFGNIIPIRIFKQKFIQELERKSNQKMEEILQKYCRNIPKIFEKYSKNILKTLRKYSKNIAKILQKYPKNFSKILQIIAKILQK